MKRTIVVISSGLISEPFSPMVNLLLPDKLIKLLMFGLSLLPSMGFSIPNLEYPTESFADDIIEVIHSIDPFNGEWVDICDAVDQGAVSIAVSRDNGKTWQNLYISELGECLVYMPFGMSFKEALLAAAIYPQNEQTFWYFWPGNSVKFDLVPTQLIERSISETTTPGTQWLFLFLLILCAFFILLCIQTVVEMRSRGILQEMRWISDRILRNTIRNRRDHLLFKERYSGPEAWIQDKLLLHFGVDIPLTPETRVVNHVLKFIAIRISDRGRIILALKEKKVLKAGIRKVLRRNRKNRLSSQNIELKALYPALKKSREIRLLLGGSGGEILDQEIHWLGEETGLDLGFPLEAWLYYFPG